MATCTAPASGRCVASSVVAPQQQRLISSISQNSARLRSDVSQCRNTKVTVQRRRKSGRGDSFICRAAIYSVTLRTPEGETTLTVPDDVYILDAAEDNGISLPYSCRSGACSSCAAVVKAGKIDQSNQSYLEDSKVEEGFVLTCVSYPLSDIVLETHQEHRLY